MARRTDPDQGRIAVQGWIQHVGPTAAELSRATLATAVRYTLQLLAARAPGAAVEVRVPPYGVVQCVAGPRHTRGTPPAVIETDPHTWLSLATGRTGWRQAVDGGTLSASGERTDLSGWLPLI